MASARDQVEAYNFAARRQVLALLQGEDAATVDPRRRLNRSLIGGILLGVVALAAVGVAGFLSGGSSATVPKEGVVVASDTGGAYVLINNVLHPAFNIASAKLIAGNKVTTVESSALASLRRGLPVGIPGAPDSLPTRSTLSTGLWSVCSIAAQASAARPQVVLTVGARAPRPLDPGAGLVVQTPDNQVWLLESGLRYQVTATASTLLGLDRVPLLPIRTEVLDLVPEGPSLTIPIITGSGSAPSVVLPFQAVVGDLVQVANGTKQPALYVVQQDGVAPVDAFAFSLLAGAAKDPVLTVAASQIVSVASKSRPDIPALWPRQALGRPTPPPAPNEPLCITYNPKAAHTSAAWPVTISEPARAPMPPHSVPVAPSAGSLPTAATGVAIPAGGGALVKATATGGVDGVYTLVTDTGLRFAITNADAVSRLGYTAASAVPVPLPFVNLLPSGPGLDPTAAGAEYAGSARAPSATVAPPGPSASPSN